MEAVHELLDVLVDPRVVGDLPRPLVERLPGRQLASEEEIRDLEERRLLGELLDRIAAIPEDPLVAVDEGDRAPGGRRVHEGRVVGEEPEVVGPRPDLTQVHRSNRAVGDRQLVGLAGAVVQDRQGFLGAHDTLSISRRPGRHASPHPAFSGQREQERTRIDLVPRASATPASKASTWTVASRSVTGQRRAIGRRKLKYIANPTSTITKTTARMTMAERTAGAFIVASSCAAAAVTAQVH